MRCPTASCAASPRSRATSPSGARPKSALRQSELRLRLLIDSIQDYAIFMLDPHGRVTTWNPGAQNATSATAPARSSASTSRSSIPPRPSSGRIPSASWSRRRVRDVRGGGLARAQGRLALLGQRRDQRRSGTNGSSCSASPRSPATSPNARTPSESKPPGWRPRRPTGRKDEFLAMLGHELRNPSGPHPRRALQLMKLRGEHVRPSNEQARSSSARSDALIRLVDDLLDVSRITRGKDRARSASGATARRRRARRSRWPSPLLEERRHHLRPVGGRRSGHQRRRRSGPPRAGGARTC